MNPQTAQTHVTREGCNVVYIQMYLRQRAKKVMSDSPGLVDFAVGLVKSVFNLPNGQVMFFEEFE